MRPIVGMVLAVAHAQCFEVVWRNKGCRAIRVEVAQLGIDEDRHMLVSNRQDLAQDTRRHNTFIVIGDDERIRLFERIFQTRDDLLFQLSCHGIA